MNKFLFLVGLLISSICFSQDSLLDNRNTPSQGYIYYSVYADSVQRADIQRMTERSINYFSELQEQRRAQAKKKAILYIVMGVAFLAILLIGLRRRGKK